LALAYITPKDGPKRELRLDKVEFEIYKFNERRRPNRARTLIISCFSEFGCETVGCMYCIPRVIRRFPGRYIIAMGWRGRDYLYRHLVDEFWEVKDEYMWLREYTRAFHHISVNLKRIEEAAGMYGEVIPSSALGKYAVGNYCITCGKFWSEWRGYSEKCPKCESTRLVRSVLTDISKYKREAVRIPPPSPEKIEWAKSILKPNTVGVFARGRKTYGRNLKPEFYVRLIQFLEDRGYNVIWLGEKQSCQPCPVEHVLDFSRLEESRDLEKTLAIISQLQFTIQFWTASTRLASMQGVPYILFESPEQIYCSGLRFGQEGKRLELTTFGPKKLVISHYFSVVDNPEGAFDLVRRAVDELRQGNYEDIVGLVESKEATEALQRDHYAMLR
jgi:hypothetical protein